MVVWRTVVWRMVVEVPSAALQNHHKTRGKISKIPLDNTVTMTVCVVLPKEVLPDGSVVFPPM